MLPLPVLLQCESLKNQLDIFCSILIYCDISLEAAAVSPDSLSQAAIIDNLDPIEAARLDKVRNIGIAVYITMDFVYGL